MAQFSLPTSTWGERSLRLILSLPAGLKRANGLPAMENGPPFAKGPNKGTPMSQAKHVRFQLKRNLYFQQGGAVPSPEMRTPESCKPKVSTLWRQWELLNIVGLDFAALKCQSLPYKTPPNIWLACFPRKASFCTWISCSASISFQVR